MDNKVTVGLVLLALACAGAHGQGLEMRVEEPAAMPAPPINPDADARAWEMESLKADLNRVERAAYEARRKRVEELTSQVRAKREALVNSEVGERAARVKDLENLVLENSPEGAKEGQRVRKDKILEKQGKAREKALEKKMEKLEAKLEKRLEKQKEKLDRKKGKGRDKNKG